MKRRQLFQSTAKAALATAFAGPLFCIVLAPGDATIAGETRPDDRAVLSSVGLELSGVLPK
jgi:hypothetical protein